MYREIHLFFKNIKGTGQTPTLLEMVILFLNIHVFTVCCNFFDEKMKEQNQ